jgi:NADPH:quinone reductase-like Zn-dependent oxidoreductase
LTKPNNLEGIPMKAIVCTKYGPPDVLELKEVGKPTPKEDEALVRVHAASVNAADFEMLRGTWSARFGGLLKPRHKILGSDIAGRIEAVGRNVTQFQPGDEVFGDLSECGFGAFAEYVCVPENALRLKPNNQEDLAILEELFAAGKVAPVIDRRYPLSEVPEALRYLAEGHAKGKVVITVE